MDIYFIYGLIFFAISESKRIIIFNLDLYFFRDAPSANIVLAVNLFASHVAVILFIDSDF